MTDVTPIDAPPKRHRWDYDNIKRLAAAATESGCEETHRFCLDCKLVRVTVHPPQGRGRPWPELIMPGTRARQKNALMPPCVPTLTQEQKQ